GGERAPRRRIGQPRTPTAAGIRKNVSAFRHHAVELCNFLRSAAARSQLLRMASAGSRQISFTSGTDAGLRGRIEQFGLATVLTFLDLERRSGQILVVPRDRVRR